METEEALIEAGRTRLRPILMTAIAAILALVPLAIGLSEGAIIAAELAIVVIGGLTTSTLLTLIIAPVIFSILDKVGFNKKKKSIYYIGNHLGLHDSTIDQLFNLGSSHATSSNKPSLADAYKLLGVTKNSTKAEIKKSYRRLMSQHHPDKLIAKGLPEEMIKIATEKTQDIRAAYEQIIQSKN